MRRQLYVARFLGMLVTLVSLAAAQSVRAEDFSFSADSMSGAMTKGCERAVLTGNALVLSGSMRISAERIEL